LAAAEDCVVGLGLAGAYDDAQRKAFAAAAPPWHAFVVDTDSHAALLGAHRGAPGVVVIVGTGSVGEALYPDGRCSLCGGWGYPAGDEGSGAWLGLRAMAIAQRALDGRSVAGALARAVWRHAGEDVAALRSWCIGAGQRRYAELAPLVFDHEAADATAARLIERAIDAVGATIVALDPEGRLPFAVTGSIGRRLARRLPAPLQARRVEPAGDTVDGALELARRALARRHREFAIGFP
jgi:glucosamine kinase